MTTTATDTVLSLEALIKGDRAAINACVDAMQSRGWVMVRLTPHLHETAQQLSQPLQHFFAQESWEPKYILNRIDHPILGYSQNSKRQALRVLTGTELESQSFPKGKNLVLKELCRLVDETLYKVTEHVCEPLFGTDSLDEIAEKNQLPFLHGIGGAKRSSKKQHVKDQDKPAYALLEAAYYDPDSSQDATVSRSNDLDELCAAHYDPGLLSLNVLSTSPGLQFQDEYENWVDIPTANSSDVGILWTGAEASNLWEASAKTHHGADALPFVPAAIHRVVRRTPDGHKQPPRLSVWSEICTRDQIFMDKDVEIKGDKVLIPNLFSDKPYIVSVEKGNLMKTLDIVQDLKGLPVSKIMRRPIFNDKGEVTDVSI